MIECSAKKPTFKSIKFQWLTLLSADKNISDRAKTVGSYIILKFLNSKLEEAWPSFHTLAEDLGKSIKYIQRAVKELEDKDWLIVTCKVLLPTGHSI